MNIVVYTKSNCPFCTSAKALLKFKGLEYAEIDIEKAPTAAAFLTEKYPEARQMPQIFIEGQRVGGFAGLQAALKEIGL